MQLTAKQAAMLRNISFRKEGLSAFTDTQIKDDLFRLGLVRISADGKRVYATTAGHQATSLPDGAEFRIVNGMVMWDPPLPNPEDRPIVDRLEEIGTSLCLEAAAEIKALQARLYGRVELTTQPTSMLSFNDLPEDVIAAASRLELYFKSHNIAAWKLCGVQSREN